MGYVELGLLNLKYDKQSNKGLHARLAGGKGYTCIDKSKSPWCIKNQRAYFDIRIDDTKRLNIMILKNVISSFMASCIPLGPNKPFVFLKFRPACPRLGLAALVLAKGPIVEWWFVLQLRTKGCLAEKGIFIFHTRSKLRYWINLMMIICLAWPHSTYNSNNLYTYSWNQDSSQNQSQTPKIGKPLKVQTWLLLGKTKKSCPRAWK